MESFYLVNPMKNLGNERRMKKFEEEFCKENVGVIASQDIKRIRAWIASQEASYLTSWHNTISIINQGVIVASKPSTHELQRIDGLFTRMKVLGLILVAMRDSYAWKIAWRSEGRQLTTRPLWRAGGPLARRQLAQYYRTKLRAGSLADPMGESPSGLGEPDLARPMVISGHFWALLCNNNLKL
ncbi:hypothetical protein KY289_016713 [Solanum tuberosum]|nr:hypothetical protein KY289_016713 [Solanum tuberosum]